MDYAYSNIRKAQEIEALVCKDESNESLIDLDTLQDIEIIHKEFQIPLNKSLREDPEKLAMMIRKTKLNWSTNWKYKFL